MWLRSVSGSFRSWGSCGRDWACDVSGFRDWGVGVCLEGQGDVVSRLIALIIHIVNPVVHRLSHVLSPPDPPSGVYRGYP